MIEFEEYKLKLNDLKPKLEALAASLNLDRVRNELERFHAMQEAPGFWDDPDRSQKIVVQTKLLEAKLEKYHAMTAQMAGPSHHLRDGSGGKRRLHAAGASGGF